jgi:hypothetical protein
LPKLFWVDCDSFNEIFHFWFGMGHVLCPWHERHLLYIQGSLIQFWLYFLFLPWLTLRLIVYPSCSWLTVLLRTPMTWCFPMTELRLGDRVRTLYLCWLIVPLVSDHPFSLAEGNDPFIYDVVLFGLRPRTSCFPLALCDDLPNSIEDQPCALYYKSL